jgi:hypothetical protein
MYSGQRTRDEGRPARGTSLTARAVLAAVGVGRNAREPVDAVRNSFTRSSSTIAVLTPLMMVLARSPCCSSWASCTPRQACWSGSFSRAGGGGFRLGDLGAQLLDGRGGQYAAVTVSVEPARQPEVTR